MTEEKRESKLLKILIPALCAFVLVACIIIFVLCLVPFEKTFQGNRAWIDLRCDYESCVCACTGTVVSF